ncbi:MAG: FAD-dependent oxidoreductase [Acidobacteriota bacterium]
MQTKRTDDRSIHPVDRPGIDDTRSREVADPQFAPRLDGLAGERPVAVIGAGPVGLAAAAHLLERGLEPVIFEAGERVAASVATWAHVPMFSAWRTNLDDAAVRLLEPTGWTAPDLDAAPTGGELIARYLEPLAAVPALASRLRLRSRVLAVGRQGLDKLRDRDGVSGASRGELPFVLDLETPAGPERFAARAVLDASGTWASPAPLGGDGRPAMGESSLGGRLATGLPDVLGVERDRFAGRRTAVIGAGHSAVHAVLDLLRLRAETGAGEVVWILRKASVDEVFRGREDDALRGRGRLATRIRKAVEEGDVEVVTPFVAEEIRRAAEGLDLVGRTDVGVRHLHVDEAIVATGTRPDLGMLREVRLDLDPAVEAPRALAPLIDPNVHSCGSVPAHGEAELRQPEAGFYLVGMKSYGRAPTFLLRTGYGQVRSIAAFLSGDLEAARTRAVAPFAADAGPCGGPPAGASASCEAPTRSAAICC